MTNLAPLPRQVVVLRAGDDLPGFAAIIEDELGAPLDLTDSTPYLLLREENTGIYVTNDECYVPNPTAGVVTFDWEGGVTTRFDPGVYQVSVRVEYDDGRRVTAPSDRTVFLKVRPGLITTIATTTGEDVLSTEGDELVLADQFDEGDALLSANGEVLRSADNEQIFVRRVP